MLHTSPPARGRGLKHNRSKFVLPYNYVAPRAGAWIETAMLRAMNIPEQVAPRAGAWIETTVLTLLVY